MIRYEKVVVLYKNAFTQVYADAPEISALKDIIRVDIRSFLRKMDEPRQPWLFLDEGKVRSIRLPRVYHVNFLQRYDMPDNNEPAVIERTRTTLTRKGIRRVERMGGNR